MAREDTKPSSSRKSCSRAISRLLPLEVSGDLIANAFRKSSIRVLLTTALVHCLVKSPHLLDLVLPIKLRVIIPVTFQHNTLVQRQVPWVDCNSMVVVFSVLTHIAPVALLLPEVETGCVRNE